MIAVGASPGATWWRTVKIWIFCRRYRVISGIAHILIIGLVADMPQVKVLALIWTPDATDVAMMAPFSDIYNRRQVQWLARTGQ